MRHLNIAATTVTKWYKRHDMHDYHGSGFAYRDTERFLMPKDLGVEKIKCDLDIREDIDHHVRAWRFRRTGMFFMAAFILLALFGLYGNGPLSTRTRTTHNDTLQYEYFIRFQSHTDISLKLQNLNETTRVAFPQQYLKNFQIESIFPEPKESRIQNDTVIYLFQTAEKGSIRFFLTPQQRGSVKGSIGINERNLDLSHFIYP